MLEPVIFVVSKNEVVNQDISSILSSLNNLLSSPEKALSYCEKIDISFDGYNNIHDELFEIPEVRNFVYKLDEEFPYWLYFCSKELHGLRTLLYCFLPPHLTDEAKAKYWGEKSLEVLTGRWFPAMNSICDFVKADEEENIRLTEVTYKYLFAEPKNNTSISNQLLQEQRDKTFDYDDNQEHFVGSHFDAFFDDMQKDVMANIGKYTEHSAIIKSSYSEASENSVDDEEWEKGFILTYPQDNLDEGIGSIVGIIEKDKNMTFISIFPHLNYGQIYEFELDKVYVWNNGHEAQLEVSLGFTDLAFYDIHYDVNRKYYQSEKKYKFQILGIAYRCNYRKKTEMEVETTPEVAEALDIPIGTRTISLVGMASFMRIDSWDRDDYSFSGIIQNVKGVYISISDIKGWICTTRVLVEGSDSENIYDMDILVTEKIWKHSHAPKVGDDIEGSVWMQGRLV